MLKSTGLFLPPEWLCWATPPPRNLPAEAPLGTEAELGVSDAVPKGLGRGGA